VTQVTVAYPPSAAPVTRPELTAAEHERRFHDAGVINRVRPARPLTSSFGAGDQFE
jgi:hypothetical protein